MPAIDSIWKASDGRLLRVVGDEGGGKIAVRNVNTNRLSYMRRRYFESVNAGIGWWLEPHSVPLLEPAQSVAAVDPHLQSEGTPSTRVPASSSLVIPLDPLKALSATWRKRADSIEGVVAYPVDTRVAANIRDCADELDALLAVSSPQLETTSDPSMPHPQKEIRHDRQ